jgi:hypothetical protein
LAAEDGGRVVDADSLIQRCVHDQQCFAQIGDAMLDRLAFRIFHEPPTDGKRTASQCYVGDPVTFDIIEMRLEVVQHVGDIGRRADGDDRLCFRNAVRRTAAPPNEWPMRIVGARKSLRKWSAAATRSSIFEEKLVFWNSPSDDPSPVKSNLKTAMPSKASFAAMCRAAAMSFVHVKQCANSA